MKTLILSLLGLLGMLSASLGGVSQPVSPNLQLKVPASEITASRDIHEIVLENGKEVDKGLVKQYQYVSSKKAKGEFIFDTGRTFTNKRLVSKGAKTQTVDFFNGDQFALQLDGSVNEINYATTTIDAFNAQTTVSQRWVQTAYASTDFPTGSGDGRVGFSSATWSTVHDAANGNDPNTALTYAVIQGDRLNAGTYYISRGFFPADTSGIGSGNTVTAAELHVFHLNLGNTGILTWSVVTTNQAATNALANGDYSLVGSTSLGDASYDNAAADGTETTFTISSPNTNISKTGTTKLGIREKDHDLANVAATHDYNSAVYCSEATAGLRPFYRVTYSAAVVVIPTPIITPLVRSLWW